MMCRGRIRSRVWFPWVVSLGLTVSLSSSALAQYIVRDLTPAGLTKAYVHGASGGQQVGDGLPVGADFGGLHALLWSGFATTAVDLHPAGYFASHAYAVGGGQQVGGGRTGPSSPSRALLWYGTAASVVDLTPAGAGFAEAFGVRGGQQVGVVGSLVQRDEHATLWRGAAASAVDLHPASFTTSRAVDTDGSQQVGYGRLDADGTWNYHALLWTGAAASVVDLTPDGFAWSQATATLDGRQVGFGGLAGQGGRRALLWSGSAASVVDLHPAGATVSSALGVSGDRQVGSAMLYGDGYLGLHAVAWSGTPESVVNLGAFVPTSWKGTQPFTIAASIVEDGTIVGTAGDDATQTAHAVMWIPVPFTPTQMSAPSVIRARPGQTIALTAALASGGKPLAGQTVDFGLVGIRNGDGGPASAHLGSAVTDAVGRATLSYNVPLNVVSDPKVGIALGYVVAEFMGNGAYGVARATTSLEVVQIVPSFSLYAASGLPGETVILRTLFVANGQPIVARTVTFLVDGGRVGEAVSDANGAAIAYTIPASTQPGLYNVTASFSGGGLYPSASRTTPALTVKGVPWLSLYPASGRPGATTTLRAILFYRATRLPGRRVAFLVDGSVVGSGITDAEGVASAAWMIPWGLSAGTRTVTASFAGDAGYGPATRSAAALTIGARVAFSLYAASGSPGQTVTLKALMLSEGKPVAGKSVQFSVEGTSVGSGVSDSTGVAGVSYTIPASLSPGVYNVTASFAGLGSLIAASRSTPALTVK